MPSGAGERAIKQSMVQILGIDKKPRGCGLFADPCHVVTCAHVIALAIPGVKASQTDKPMQASQVVFPYRRHTEEIFASVVVWKPELKLPPSDLVEDIAVLRLDRPAPSGAVSHSILDLTEWAGRSYMAQGYTESEPKGAWADGRFKGETVDGWVQLMAFDGSDLQIDHGFSGGGVWDEHMLDFAGILVANRKRGNNLKPVSYMIPGTLLKQAWPDLPVVSRQAAVAAPAGCILDIGGVMAPHQRAARAEVRFTVSNTTNRAMLLQFLTLEVLTIRPLMLSLMTLPAGPVDTSWLHATIDRTTKTVQLLPQPYRLDPDETHGFLLKLDAEEGFVYEFQLNATWQFLGSQPEVISSGRFDIQFPFHTPVGLKRMADQLAALQKTSPTHGGKP
jgi:hypothetical protein